jgi:hypothetical protein
MEKRKVLSFKNEQVFLKDAHILELLWIIPRETPILDKEKKSKNLNCISSSKVKLSLN